MVKSDSLLTTVTNLLQIARKGVCSEDELAEILSLLPVHSSEAIIGRILGYSVSDYAFAVLKWLNINTAEDDFKQLSQARQLEINELVGKRYYEKIDAAPINE